MAFGFGFNKAKVLASAEKYVQQGKITNAISEYEKIIEKDAKDLTVLNTIGDLYARLGQSEKAGEYFKRVGDTYATEGFTVKAIAMYKKLTKVNPSNTPVIQRLAELYTQQGLYSDARQQYRYLADNSVRNHDLAGAVKIFQKMLEIEPDNVSLQSKLADLYLKLGKKDDARDIYLRAAQGLFERGAAEQGDQALERVLSVDPSHPEALLLRAKVALDAGDGVSAASYLEKLPDIDSRADALRSLLRAYILSGHAEAAEGIARKLVSVHNDLSGIRCYADFLLATGAAESALRIFDEYVDQLVVGDSGALVIALQGLTGQVKESPASLERLRTVFQKAGSVSNIPEVNELLAHALVQANELAKARDLYKELSEIEPSNPQHLLNYRQVLARMGEEPTARPLGETEGEQALFIEEIESPPPPAQPDYPASLEERIGSVLTDAELFESYNKPQQAVAPLEGILSKAPNDVRVNQRLIAVYQRLERFADAARCCDTLKDVYQKAAMFAEAHKFADMATHFRERAGIPEPEAVAAAEHPPEMPVIAPEPASTPQMTAAAFAVPPPEAAASPADLGEAHEIDLSSEWEAAISTPGSGTQHEPAAGQPEPEETEVHPSAISDLLEEISFYISQGMFDEARSAISRCEKLAPASLELAELKQQLSAAESGVPLAPAEEVTAVDVAVEAPPLPAREEIAADLEPTVVEFDFAGATAEAVQAPESEYAPTAETAPATEEQPVEEVSFEPTALKSETVAIEPELGLPVEEPAIYAGTDRVAREPEPEVAAEAEAVEGEVAQEQPTEVPVLEHAAEVAEAEEPALVAEPEQPVLEQPLASDPVLTGVAAASSERDVLADFVLDLQDSLPAGFGAPLEPAKAAAVAAGASATMPAPQPFLAVAAAPQVVAAASPTPVSSGISDLSSLSADDASTVLSDLFAEFKEEVGEAQEDVDDPDTHYNLGVAFKEMGLLDEAIGELQKVCKSIDRGVAFTQVMQAYTWLASCFVEKGVPEASVKWYSRALTVAGDEESRTALHYDLASAYEAAGDRPQALKHFTEVYGTNIDYRDVAERIKALKA